MSRVATAIRGLQWMKMTMVNSGLERVNKYNLILIEQVPDPDDHFHTGNDNIRHNLPSIDAHTGGINNL